MKIAVCMKQVPADKETRMDPEKGTLIRNGNVTTNPYDLSALELALTFKERYDAQVDVFTMGPQSASSLIYEAYALGIDHGYLISDKSFAGADVLATSYTLAQAIRSIDSYDLILCGKQSVDGDTAQTGPAIAAHLNLPYACFVREITDLDEDRIEVISEYSENLMKLSLPFPCLICVNREIATIRIATLKNKLAAKKKKIITIYTLMLIKKKKFQELI